MLFAGNDIHTHTHVHSETSDNNQFIYILMICYAYTGLRFIIGENLLLKFFVK
jgi:hypothetical protein